ncbi:MAG TPA: amidohydrolase family protein [Saprospiraceae bacterium]|nr:amidohydrolase family protein [Saprospiraceae bacterium]HMQ84474.1 amidohydrolase family protein [Saprospiraceae bacterium]
MEIIDAHQHFWHFQAAEYPWISDELRLLQRDFLPEELALLYRENGISGCVAVEARGSERENLFLLDLAEKNDFIKGIVGWMDLRFSDLEQRLSAYADQPKIKGFRYPVQAEADVNFLLRPEWLRGMEVLGRFNYCFDLLIFPHQLGAALELVRRFPEQRFVLDHLAKPYIKDGFMDGWQAQMEALAQLPNVWCKISGMVTEADWSGWHYADLLPYLDVVFGTFGSDRLMFGSDWPVCTLAAPYEKVKDILARYLVPFTKEARVCIWAGNARECYQLS